MNKLKQDNWDELNDYLDDNFPKGKDKRRGEALVLIALAFKAGSLRCDKKQGKNLEEIKNSYLKFLYSEINCCESRNKDLRFLDDYSEWIKCLKVRMLKFHEKFK